MVKFMESLGVPVGLDNPSWAVTASLVWVYSPVGSQVGDKVCDAEVGL